MTGLEKPAAQKSGTDLWVRLASSVLLAPLILFCVIWGGWVLAVLLLVINLACIDEWLRMCGRRGKPHPDFASVAPFGPAACVVGLILLVSSLAGLTWLRMAPHGEANILFLLAVVWTTDSAAYASGRILGGRKLAPAISPGKTISGALGGLLGAIAVAEIFLFWNASPLKAGLVAALLSMISQSGDLLESWCKRRAGVKDSGHLIPGHGGMLDRLDGLLAAAPAAALVVWMGGQGKGLWWS